MDEKDLKKLEQDLLKQIDTEVNLEKQIKNQAKEVAAILIMNKTANILVNDKDYVASYQARNNVIQLVIADHSLYKILRERYRPYTATMEVNNNFTLIENLETAVEAFIRHVLGMIRVGPLEEGDYLSE